MKVFQLEILIVVILSFVNFVNYQNEFLFIVQKYLETIITKSTKILIVFVLVAIIRKNTERQVINIEKNILNLMQ